MLLKLKLWWANRQLEIAARHEEELRESAKYMRLVTLPTLEHRVVALEAEIVAKAITRLNRGA